ncbi:MAG: MerR family transcriptional regulator [Flammeovirgaceae bacterium]
MVSTYTIKDLENLTGIKAHTIRIWEQRYGIVQPQRSESNVRFYSADDLKNMLNITVLNNNGYKISKIAKMSTDQMCELALAVLDKKENYQDQISALSIAMIDLDEKRFEKIMNTNILHHGFEYTMMEIVYPFLLRIGALWQTKAINPAHEHFISNLIRQKLIVAIDGQVAKSDDEAKTFMLFLPEGELHELSLLFASYLIKSYGHKVFYLGQSLPLRDLKEVYDVHKPDFLFSIFTSAPSGRQTQRYVDNLASNFPEAGILLTGYQILGQGIDITDNMEVMPHFKYFKDFLKSLEK